MKQNIVTATKRNTLVSRVVDQRQLLRFVLLLLGEYVVRKTQERAYPPVLIEN
jgi:hypothetical protein